MKNDVEIIERTILKNTEREDILHALDIWLMNKKLTEGSRKDLEELRDKVDCCGRVVLENSI